MLNLVILEINCEIDSSDIVGLTLFISLLFLPCSHQEPLIRLVNYV